MASRVGSIVTYVDHVAQPHAALVTADWGHDDNPHGSLNIVFVETDESKHDTWGRQIGRDSSVVHRSAQAAPGNYWFDPTESADI